MQTTSIIESKQAFGCYCTDESDLSGIVPRCGACQDEYEGPGDYEQAIEHSRAFDKAPGI